MLTLEGMVQPLLDGILQRKLAETQLKMLVLKEHNGAWSQLPVPGRQWSGLRWLAVEGSPNQEDGGLPLDPYNIPVRSHLDVGCCHLLPCALDPGCLCSGAAASQQHTKKHWHFNCALRQDLALVDTHTSPDAVCLHAVGQRCILV
jgi:hypothetical protein